MKKIRTIVVDDEPLARARIVKLLEEYEDVILIGEGRNGQEAARLITDYQPDLAFLDIKMPDFNSFEALTKVETTNLPFIIFVTAYDHYAIKAFDVKAVDYLLKPFDDERFQQAIEQARKQLELQQNAVLHHRMVQLLNEFQQEQTDELKILEIKDRGKVHRINIHEVLWFESQGNYVKIHTTAQSWLLRETLQNLENQLDTTLFLRIHRSLLVNVNYVKKVHYEGNNQYAFILKNEKRLQSSRGYKSMILDYLNAEEAKRRVQ